MVEAMGSVPRCADVVVVGAGLAGLAATRRLVAEGLQVALVESGDAPGGRVRTDVLDGVRLDRGFQLFNPAYPEARPRVRPHRSRSAPLRCRCHRRDG